MTLAILLLGVLFIVYLLWRLIAFAITVYSMVKYWKVIAGLIAAGGITYGANSALTSSDPSANDSSFIGRGLKIVDLFLKEEPKKTEPKVKDKELVDLLRAAGLPDSAKEAETTGTARNFTKSMPRSANGILKFVPDPIDSNSLMPIGVACLFGAGTLVMLMLAFNSLKPRQAINHVSIEKRYSVDGNYCSHCGEPSSPTANFCSRCGAKHS